MTHIIKNFEALATNHLRRDALEITEAGLRAIDTSTALRQTVVVTQGVAQIDGQTYDLSKYKNIYIVGFGKVACGAAYTLEEILNHTVREGAVVGIKEQVCDSVLTTYTGTHPLPSRINYDATKHIEEVARKATADDLVLVIVSGGGSALLCSSMGECDQGNKLFAAFLQTGGTIEELNTVRKHISHLKGGGLAKVLHPATVVSLIFSDVPGGDLSAVASGPTYFDDSRVADAQAIIDRYSLGDYTLQETPKENIYFEKVQNVAVVSNITALEAMQAAAHHRGYAGNIISSTQYFTASETREVFLNAAADGQVALAGGETKLSVPSDCTGKGGRNDYLALEMLECLGEGDVFVSIASDGKDNTDAAGAIVDRDTLQAAAKAQLIPNNFLECMNSYPFFEEVGGHLHTGLLESNVSDLMLYLRKKNVPKPVPITDIAVKVVSDSRGKDTIAVEVYAGAMSASFSVPSGASTGATEVYVVPATTAAKIVKKLVLPKLRGVNVFAQTTLDDLLHKIDGTANFSKIGGNVALGISVAAVKLAAALRHIPTHQYIAELFSYREQATTPRLFVNLINGGKHATMGSVIQEHQIIPDTDDVKIALQVVSDVQSALYEILVHKYGKEAISIGDEGGFMIPATDPVSAFAHLQAAIATTQTSVPITIGADMAASSFYDSGHYTPDGLSLSPSELHTLYAQIHTTVPALTMVEDPFMETAMNDFATYQKSHKEVLVIGDDLTTTNQALVANAIAAGAITGLIVKPNQIGTITDTLATMAYAYDHNVRCIVSHRSGETMDDFIADLAFGTKCFGMKAGAPTATERKVKYDRLVTISTH